jgi:cell division protein ZapA
LEATALSDKNRINVEIYGQQYTIVGDESTSHLRQVAHSVDDKMREIGQKNPSLDTTKLAVLTAVNTMHEYYKLLEKIEALEIEINQQKK